MNVEVLVKAEALEGGVEARLDVGGSADGCLQLAEVLEPAGFLRTLIKLIINIVLYFLILILNSLASTILISHLSLDPLPLLAIKGGIIALIESIP